MPAIVPSLTTNILAGSTTYRTDINSNFANILAAFQAVDAAFASQLSGQSFLTPQDWSRKISASDEDIGVLGGIQFTDSSASGTFSIDPFNADDKIVIYTAGGTRREHSFTTSTGFTGALSTLNLSDGTYTIYAGFDAVGTTDFSLSFSTSSTAADLFNVATFELTVSGGTYSIAKVNLIDRTVLFDNTIFQRRFESSIEVKSSFPTSSTGGNFQHMIVCVPFDHMLESLIFEAASQAGGSLSVTIDAQFHGQSPVLGTFDYDTTTSADTDPDRIEIVPASPYDVTPLKANTFYHFEQTVAQVGSFAGINCGVRAKPVFGIPVTTINSP